MSATKPRSSESGAVWLALVVVVGLLVAWIATLPASPAWGWDESMHAELPAARMALALKSGELGAASAALLDCQQYPFVWPVCLAVVQFVTGVSEHVARCAGLVALALMVWGVFRLARELVTPVARSRRDVGEVTGRGTRKDTEREARRDAEVGAEIDTEIDTERDTDGEGVEDAAARRARFAPWFALVFAATCPLAVSFGGTLFLEVPFACVATFTLLAWLRLRRDPTPRRAWIAGAWITVAFFTKFNYALMLGLGLAIDAAVELALAARRGEGGRALGNVGRAVLIPALGALWWFVLPLPGGFEVAAAHRGAFAEFLQGNLGGTSAPASVRLLQLAAYGAPTPRVLALWLAAALIAVRFVREPRVRLLVIVFLVSVIPVCLHPFHLERFWIPSGPALFALAGLGLASVLPTSVVARWVGLAILAVGSLVMPGRDTFWLADRLGLGATESANREYQRAVFAERRALFSGRSLPTNGLDRAVHDALFGLVVREVKPSDRVGWLGASSETSPAVVHLALLENSARSEADVARFLRDAPRPMDVTILGLDPRLDDAALRAWADSFDVILATDPPDLKNRRDRQFPREYRERLVAMGWIPTELGRIAMPRPNQAPLEVTLFACRPGK